MANSRHIVTRPNHPNACSKGQIKLSRLLMSEFLNRPLEEDEHIHHINGDKTDDRIENLAIMSPQDHISLHTKGDKHWRWIKNRTKICLNCNQEFSRDDTHHFARNKFCSVQCSSQYHSKERSCKAKITQEIADEIRSYKGILPSRKLAVKFNISPTHIKRILRGECWA